MITTQNRQQGSENCVCVFAEYEMKERMQRDENFFPLQKLHFILFIHTHCNCEFTRIFTRELSQSQMIRKII